MKLRLVGWFLKQPEASITVVIVVVGVSYWINMWLAAGVVAVMCSVLLLMFRPNGWVTEWHQGQDSPEHTA